VLHTCTDWRRTHRMGRQQPWSPLMAPWAGNWSRSPHPSGPPCCRGTQCSCLCSPHWGLCPEGMRCRTCRLPVRAGQRKMEGWKCGCRHSCSTTQGRVRHDVRGRPCGPHWSPSGVLTGLKGRWRARCDMRGCLLREAEVVCRQGVNPKACGTTGGAALSQPASQPASHSRFALVQAFLICVLTSRADGAGVVGVSAVTLPAPHMEICHGVWGSWASSAPRVDCG
jgi:hypothetical protein